ncbi:MAG: hypothetical protein LBD01_00600 [Puniceicoccales bacterium]|nr:hypothetical protein [Puniceicoccales bacterium]
MSRSCQDKFPLRHELVRYAQTNGIRCESTGAMFVSYAGELSNTYATLAITRMIEHLKIHGVDPQTR